MAATLVGLTDAGGDRGRLQTVEPRAQPLIAGLAGAPAGEGQDVIGRSGDESRGRQSRIMRFDNLALREDTAWLVLKPLRFGGKEYSATITDIHRANPPGCPAR